MLGRYVRIQITHPIHSAFEGGPGVYLLNFGSVEGAKSFSGNIEGAFVLGVGKPVRNFDGRVVAVLRRKGSETMLLAVAGKGEVFIDNQIAQAVSFALDAAEYTMECLYENSCGAVVFRRINDEIRFLLIKNRRSAHWGFPKGHMEAGETEEQTARREVLEETGVTIRIIPEFSATSEYTIQNRVEKRVTIFLAAATNSSTSIQHEEIEDYAWQNFDKAMESLRFDNDRDILRKAFDFLGNNPQWIGEN